MTYILGWKFDHYAYVVADTALTLIHPIGLNIQRIVADRTTSFGELNVCETQRVVSEGVLKIINMNQLCVAFSGDVQAARSVADDLASRLRQGAPPREALEQALLSNGPFDPNRQINLIAGIPASPDPILLAFNIDGDQRVHEVPDQTVVQFGSIHPSYKSLTANLLKQLQIFKAAPDRLLVGALAIVQSYGIHDYLLQAGAGGAFVGLWIGPRFLQWQQDLLFILQRDLDSTVDMISSVIRDSVLIVRSNVSNACRYFGDSINDGLSEEWKRRWWDEAFDFTEQGRFDFVILLNIAARIVTVVEMLKCGDSEHFRIHVRKGEGAEEAFRANIAMSPLLVRAMTERLEDFRDGSIPFKFNWFPFSRPQ